MAPKSRIQIQQLANKVQHLVQSLLAELEKVDGETTLYSADWDALTNDLQNSTQELLLRVVPPQTFLRQLQLSHYDLVAFQVAFEFNLFDFIPQSGVLSLSELSERAGIDEDRVSRVIRLLAIHSVFTEPEEDIFAHTATSKLLAQDVSFRSALAVQLDEMYQAASSTAEAIKKSPYEQRADVTPFSTRFGSSIYDFYQNHSNRADRFGKAMQGATALQDLFPPPSLSSDNQIIPRVRFQQHNFFEPQPITDAKAYFMKHSLHNHSDADCVRILRSLVPALEKAGPSIPLLINEGVLPAPGERMRRDQELTLRRGDMCMMVTLSAKERTKKQFNHLLNEADPRLQVQYNPVSI
ncbi:hypothetical protein Trco_001670 [Trichoderma cornu-damae]|uniref:O-methyltransferase domain-containing protein n=1 Tax=Trichoderma cornu-damae TaxID=654480 RepID=A0A9P8QNF3_9HYPO|nr:hypothetical protein Trco_001670 [Trichoderma cornu-damae]